MIGPWSHAWPHDPYPKPGMEWRHEAVRWFDQWLKGENTGILDEPAFAVYVRDWYPPDVSLEEIPGEWRFEEGFPIEALTDPKAFYDAGVTGMTVSAFLAAGHSHQVGTHAPVVAKALKALVAGKLGMKPESLSRALAHLRRYGVESTRGAEVHLHDLASLREFCLAET